ncbi:MAG TPA: D-aminoacylase [Candidatus Dormibacteraeota bacterium]|nr:D-aminoacylase [Candidatus Dormibacteraeota bacterium]
MFRAIVLFFAAFLLVAAHAAAQSDSSAKPFDVLITGGRIVDGAGNPWFVADLGIRDGVIAEIGSLAGRAARRTIDARGSVVTPGFIDMMGGSSLPLLLDPVSAESKLRQGITTMMVGEGDSLAPQNDRTAAQDIEGASFKISWRTYAEYFRLLDKKGVAMNVIHNVGAAQVREMVIGDEDRAPTPAQLAEMKVLVAQAMKDGSVGLSTALIYPPGTFAKTEELIELSKVAAQYSGVYFSHMRNESSHLLEAIQEVIRIGREAGIPAHIYHLKAAGQENWLLMQQALDLIQQARDQGVDITADIYPYIRNGLGLRALVHPRHFAAGPDAFFKSLANPTVREEIRREMETASDWENWYRWVGSNWDNVLISSVGPKGDSSLNGLSVEQAAKRRAVGPWDLFFELIKQGDPFVSPKSMDEAQKHAALRAPFVSIDCDAAPINPANSAASLGQSSAPRAFGTFARILAKYVREEHVISLEDAVRKMSSLPANSLKLFDRGRLSPGFRADILVFDPAKVQDTATFDKPLSYSVGFDYVLVNGALVIDNGRSTGALPGSVLRH